MTVDSAEIREKILLEALKNVAFDGWSQDTLMTATKEAGYDKDMAVAVFPDGLSDLVGYFSEWADGLMLAKLKDIDIEDLKVRARIAKAVMARFEAIEPHKEAVREAAKYYARPFRSFKAKQMVWATADKIWDWAGDTATDYNRYTKRGLLSFVITSTTLYWLSKNDATLDDVDQFLRARIEEVLKLGQAASKLKSFQHMAEAMPFKSPFSKSG